MNSPRDSNITAPIRSRGRLFTSNDLEVIQDCVSKYYDQGRTKISRAVCTQLGWKQPNGWLKDRACRDVLTQLDELKIVQLPPKLVRHSQKKSNLTSKRISYLSEYDLVTELIAFPETVDLEFAKGNKNEKLWNELVDKYHYLGHRSTVGRCIKYLIKSNDRLLGAIAFSSPAWRLAPRDTVLKAIGVTDPHEQVINNSRFLILPYIRIPNLASHVLSLTTKQIVEDWRCYYSVTPLVAETFVQPSLFEGTCYNAANWVEVGITKGYAKRGASYRNSQEPKKIYLYGLNKEIRSELYRYSLRHTGN